MKHAFLMTVHSYPDLFGEILKRISSQGHFVFVNVDKKVDDTPFKIAAETIENVFFTDGVKRSRVNWGGFSQIKATLDLLSTARKIQPDYYHLISGQDFPCVNTKAFDTFFEQHSGQSFMHYDSKEEALAWKYDKYPERYKRYHFNDLYIINRKVSNVFAGILTVLTKFIERPDIDNIAAGWSWFSWHKNVVEYIFDYLRNNPLYVKRFHFTSCCDEIFFHTILNSHTENLLINTKNALRYIEWHPKREYYSLPLILDEREYKDIIESKAFFCRKVDPVKSSGLIKLLKTEDR